MLKRLASPHVATAVANLCWLGLERGVQIVVAIVISGFLARYFGPDTFGKWQYANTLLLVLAPLTWVCGAEILVPTMVREAERLPTILGSAFALRFSVSLLALLVTWGVLAVGHVDPIVAAMLAGLALTMIFREPFGVISAWLQSRTYSKPALLTSMSTALIKAAVVIGLVHIGLAATGFGWLWAAESAAIAAVLIIYYAKSCGGRLDWHIDRILLRRFASSGTVFWLGLVCMYLFLKLDRLMLQRVVDFAELGRYSAAQQLNENWIALSLMLAQTLAPAFVYRVDAPAALRRNLLRLTLLAALVMTLGATLLAVSGAFIISHVFGPAYTGAIGIFRWAVWLSVLAGVEAIGNLAVLKYQAKFVLLAKWLLALIVAFCANLVLIPRYGGYGALMGLACGYLAAVAVNLYFIRLRLRS